jgi:hypothetical protein
MSDAPQNRTNTLIIALAAVVIVLAAGVGYLIWNDSQALPSVTPQPANNGGTPGTGTNGTGTGTPGTGTTGGTPVAFDAKTATQVPAGTAPVDFVKLYHEDVIAGKYADAYAMLPLDKQQSYGDAAAYEAQVKGYGITGYEIGTPTENGDELSVAATQVTPQMPITYTWTFKKVGDQWYVTARVMGGATQ